MASKTYNINLILILILIIVLLWMFMTFSKASYQYYDLSTQKIIEGATTFGTEFKPTKGQLISQKPLQTNWGCSFTVKLNSVPGDWRQIIGITPDSNGSDSRFLAAWICGGTGNLHLRTRTEGNWDASITDCNDNIKIPLGQYVRMDVISNKIDGGKQMISFIMTVGNGQPRQIKNESYDAPYYKKQNTPNINIFATYNNFLPIDGTIKDVVFVTGDGTIVTSNLTDAIGEINQDAARKSGFTTMEDTCEGLTNIGGLGNNGNIPGITPPTNSVNPSDTINYTAIKSEDGLSDLCPRSVVQPTDPSFNWISQYGYNYPISFSPSGQVSESVPICSPDDLYTIQKRILKELNDFNAEYSDYMTYLYNKKHSAKGDTSPILNYATGMTQESANTKYGSIGSINDISTYRTLKQDIHTYNNLLKANKAYYPDPENPKDLATGLSRLDPILLSKEHKKIVNQRNELDTKLLELNNVQNSAAGESKMQMDSSIYVTLLWTTLATSIVYFMFV